MSVASMGKATDQLKGEHEIISESFDVLNTICERISSNTEVDYSDIDKLLNFITIYVDKCHHGKEEKYLFPLMGKADESLKSGPIYVMLDEHNTAREYIKTMKNALESMKSGKNEGKTFSDTGYYYIRLMGQHIIKENNVLFNIADKLFSEEIQTEMLKAFESFERNEIQGQHEELEKELEILSKKYNSKS
ncbi:MAG: hemerythrin domain-containing protein [Thermoplasmata archaeon]